MEDHRPQGRAGRDGDIAGQRGSVIKGKPAMTVGYCRPRYCNGLAERAATEVDCPSDSALGREQFKVSSLEAK